MHRLAALLGLLLSSPFLLAEDDPARLFASKPCATCHHPDQPRLGPSLQAIAALYADQPDAATRLAQRIRQGGQGNWGPIPMPPQPVSEAESRLLAEWILKQR